MKTKIKILSLIPILTILFAALIGGVIAAIQKTFNVSTEITYFANGGANIGSAYSFNGSALTGFDSATENFEIPQSYSISPNTLTTEEEFSIQEVKNQINNLKTAENGYVNTNSQNPALPLYILPNELGFYVATNLPKTIIGAALYYVKGLDSFYTYDTNFIKNTEVYYLYHYNNATNINSFTTELQTLINQFLTGNFVTKLNVPVYNTTYYTANYFISILGELLRLETTTDVISVFGNSNNTLNIIMESAASFVAGKTITGVTFPANIVDSYHTFISDDTIYYSEEIVADMIFGFASLLGDEFYGTTLMEGANGFNASGVVTSSFDFIINGGGQSIDTLDLKYFNSLNSVITITKNITNITDNAIMSINKSSTISEFIVNEENLNFIAEEGLLYNFDKTKLIAYPANKPNQKFVLEEGLIVGSSAFYNSKGIKILETSKQNIDSNLNLSGSTFTINFVISNELSNSWKYITNRFSVPYNIIYSDITSGLQFAYDINLNGYIVTGYRGTDAKVTIPLNYTADGVTAVVKKIGNNAFLNNTTITSVLLNSGIICIGENSFEGTNLLSIDLTKVDIKEIGNNAFGTRTDKPIVIYCDNSEKELIKLSHNKTYDFDINMSAFDNKGSITNIPDFVLKTSNNTLKSFKLNYNNIKQNINCMVVYDDSINSLNAEVKGAITFDNRGTMYLTHNFSLLQTQYNEVNATQLFNTSSLKPNVYTTPFAVNLESPLIRNCKYKFDMHLTQEGEPCYTENTLITLADGTQKRVSEVTYDDLLLVWNFDEGKFDYAYPVWIAKTNTSKQFYKITFNDNSTLEVVINHRLFSIENMNFTNSIDSNYSQIGKEFFAYNKSNGNINRSTLTITNIELITKECNYYNIVTSQHMNVFANKILTSCGLNNLYPITNEFKFNSTFRDATLNGGTGKNGTMYDYSELDNRIPYYMYVGLRAGELKWLGNVLFKGDHAKAIETGNKYCLNMMEHRKDLPKTALVSLSNGQKQRVSFNSTITLPNLVEENKTFVGWYNSFDGKIYAADTIVTILMNTHFTEVWG